MFLYKVVHELLKGEISEYTRDAHVVYSCILRHSHVTFLGSPIEFEEETYAMLIVRTMYNYTHTNVD